ncbi:MAG: acyl-CoA dehydratase activase [Clostridiales bacterium]|nr:acyl-CoA dehydratase activase [Clostridiales bacterium]
MYTLGIDIGSSSSKAVILEDGQRTVAEAAVQVGTGTSGPSRVLEEVFAGTGLTRADMAFTVATGYGRFSIEGADKQISEITCHAKGIHHLIPDARTIIDIGGQDAKAIQLDSRGNISKFVMNDKCAAGTGRFLDVMSRVLEIPLDKMGEAHFRATEVAPVSSTCTVFAESEVISQLSKGLPRENIVAGVHQSVASKACALAYRVGVEPAVVMCGGVAQNPGVVDAMEKELGQSIIVAPHPQLTGALGAALLAYETWKKEHQA